MALGDGEHISPRAARRQGIGGDAAGLGIHRRAGRQRLVEGGASSGSTPMSFTLPPYQAAMPPMSPPPPTATKSVSRSGASCSNSSPTLPWPSKVSGWS
jgi:hypothetical protein